MEQAGHKITQKKYLVFDGISQVHLGLKVYGAMASLGIQASYVDPKAYKKIAFYKYRKSLCKRWCRNNYYYHPQLSTAIFEKIVQQEQPDIVLVIGFSYSYISYKQLLPLKEKYGFQMLLWDTDSINLLNNKDKIAFYLREEMPRHDHIYFSSSGMQQFFAQHGFSNTSFLPFAGEAKALSAKIQRERKAYDICFVGDPDMRRLLLLSSLADYNIVVYGKRWQHYLPLMGETFRKKVITKNIYGDELQQIMRQSKIILNVTKPLSNSLGTGITDRIFNIIMNSSFVLSDHCDELSQLFKINEEIATFQGREDLLQKINYYLADDNARENIINKGKKAVEQKHLWTHRATSICHAHI